MDVNNIHHENIKNMQTSLLLLHEDQATSIHLASRGIIENDDGSFNDLMWLQEYLHEGDEVTIKIVEGDKPDDDYEVEDIYGTVLHETSLKTRYCSFCGAKDVDVKYMMEGFAGNICGGCIKECWEGLNRTKQ